MSDHTPIEDDDDIDGPDYYNDCWTTVPHPMCRNGQGVYVTEFGAACVDIDKKPSRLEYCREYVPK